MVFEIIWTILGGILIFAIIYNLTKLRKTYEIRIINKCKNDDIMTKANLVSMDRGYASTKSKISEFLDDFIYSSIIDVTQKIEYAQLQIVNGETLNKLENEVSKKIEKEMSEAFINTLTLIYNKEELAKEIIPQKIKFLCESWTNNRNQTTQQAVSEEKNKYSINV